MTKYRGKHNGQTRGAYQRTLLYYEPKNYIEASKLDDTLACYLLQQGYSVGSHIDNQHNFCAYHVAGATIGVSALLEREPDVTSGPKHYVQLRLVSNNNLTDVVQKIIDKFPVFKELNDPLEFRP